MSSLRALALLAPLAALMACGGGEAPPPAEPTPPPAAAPPAAPAPGAAATSPAEVLAASPLKLQTEVKEAGLQEALATLVPTELPPGTTDDPDRVAMRTGSVLAWTILAGDSLPKDAFLARLRFVRDGMAKVGTGQGLLANIDSFVVNVENDAASRADFLTELDNIRDNMVPEEGWGPNDKTGPLLQAGGWLAGTNTVARAVVKSGDAAAADKLLRRPEVARYYLGYLQTGEGAQKAGPFREKLVETLKTLDEVGSQPQLGLDGAKRIADVTDALLALM